MNVWVVIQITLWTLHETAFHFVCSIAELTRFFAIECRDGFYC